MTFLLDGREMMAGNPCSGRFHVPASGPADKNRPAMPWRGGSRFDFSPGLGEGLCGLAHNTL